MAMIPKGTIIEGPDGQSYEVTMDILPGGPWPTSKHFVARGGAPEPVVGMIMPGWLERYLQDMSRKAS